MSVRGTDGELPASKLSLTHTNEMKKTIALAFLLITALSTTTGFVISRGTQNMRVRMSAKDLPEYGLTIITPSDPDFDVPATEFLKDLPADVLDSIRPLTFLIRNKSARTVVAHAIIWDCVDVDGKTQRFKDLHANSEALTDAEEYFAALPRTNLDKTIRPGAARLFSLLALPQSTGRDSPGVSVTSHDSGLGHTGGGGAENLAQDASRLLSKCVELTVSIDGVFFEDGTFAGPDQAGSPSTSTAIRTGRKSGYPGLPLAQTTRGWRSTVITTGW
jgi:hypothetical protein